MAYSVTTQTPVSPIAAIPRVVLIGVLIMLPFFAGRATIQDIFFILPMLVLAQFSNLLAGYGGLLSITEQAFVGMGAYALFGVVILWGMDPVPAILCAGVAALVIAVPTAFFAFRLNGAYFAIGTWVIAEVVRLLVAQWKALGGGTGTSLPRDATRDMWFVSTIEDALGLRHHPSHDLPLFRRDLGHVTPEHYPGQQPPLHHPGVIFTIVDSCPL